MSTEPRVGRPVMPLWESADDCTNSKYEREWSEKPTRRQHPSALPSHALCPSLLWRCGRRSSSRHRPGTAVQASLCSAAAIAWHSYPSRATRGGRDQPIVGAGRTSLTDGTPGDAKKMLRIYREYIQPNERAHQQLGQRLLGKYATTPELQRVARETVGKVLDIAAAGRAKAAERMGTACFPGC